MRRRQSLALGASLVLLLPLMLMLSLQFSGSGAGPRRLLAQVDPSDTPEPPDPTDVPWVEPYYEPYDGRVDPRAADRVAVYCYSRYWEVEVWGIDNLSQGFFLNTFDYFDVLDSGTRGMSVAVRDKGTVSLVVDKQYNFVVRWNGPYGTFSKAFNCPFTGATPTWRSASGSGARPGPTVWAVVTVTPAPSLTPYPTQRLY